VAGGLFVWLGCVSLICVRGRIAQVWVLLGCTAVAVGLLVGLIERINCSLRGHKHKDR
jgi:hypothetical protein